jgi:cytochrome P450
MQISAYDDVNAVLLSPKFVQGGFQLAGKELVQDAILMLDGKRHARRRGIMSRTLNDNLISAMREKHLKPAVDLCLAEIANGSPVVDGVVRAELVAFAQRSVHRVAAGISGVDGLEDLEAVDRLVSLIRRITAGIQVQFARLPEDVVLADAKAAMREFDEQFLTPSRERRMALIADVEAKRRAPEELPQDLLTQILMNRTDPWDGDDKLPVREVAHFMAGATQTTAASLVLLILRLEEWFGDHPEDRELVQNDPGFLRGAAFESLRLTVGAPARLRTATDEVKLPSGATIKKGETVALLFIPANMSKGRFGDDADAFNPRRDVGNATPWGLAFGAGAHACPGRPLVTGNRSLKAQTSVDGTMVTIARRLYEAGLRLDPNDPPVPESSTHYTLFAKVPVEFTKPENLRSDDAASSACPAHATSSARCPMGEDSRNAAH